MTSRRISVIGLGYVGLPVAVGFAEKFSVKGFDINQTRINELKAGIDQTHEIDTERLKASSLQYTSQIEDLKTQDFHIIAVPTPINEAKQPDLTPLIKASESVGSILKPGDIVVYESTVFPGATEEVCLPILVQKSGLTPHKDFKIGYSPERINPGDKEHDFTSIVKVVSGEDEETLQIVAETYASVVKAGVCKARSIKVAEAAKVIENTQRDVNIALMNELTLIFDKMNISTYEVLEAAKTKWNFLPFTPGLVGGHCIGVDPYYLTYKAEMLGHHPEVILSGRRINDSMGKFIAEKTVKSLIQQDINVKGAHVIVLGLTFKENCPDLRNTRVIDIVRELQSYDVKVSVCDPEASKEEAFHEYGIELIDFEKLTPADAVIGAVAHRPFAKLSDTELAKLTTAKTIAIDVKNFLPRTAFHHYWSF